MTKSILVIAMLGLAAGASLAQSVPAAIYTDPPPDKEHPAKLIVVHIPSHGVLINGVVYQASGAGVHPTVVLCHGLPGNEKNLDLAQTLRRAGWNAVTFNYRGSWGSPGNFRFAQTSEDTAAVLAFLRVPANAASLGVDTHRIVLAGHSMGGWAAALTAAKDPGLAGVILISAADMGRARGSREKAVAAMADNMESLAGVTAESMADEVAANAKAFAINNAAGGLARTPLFVITSDDGLAPTGDALVKAVEAKGGHDIKTAHLATDHSYSDHRLALESAIVQWLSGR
jgi:pimeloyl-ACP methyl ester carboxylesterase